jgi:hypothetical protein
MARATAVKARRTGTTRKPRRLTRQLTFHSLHAAVEGAVRRAAALVHGDNVTAIKNETRHFQRLVIDCLSPATGDPYAVCRRLAQADGITGVLCDAGVAYSDSGDFGWTAWWSEEDAWHNFAVVLPPVHGNSASYHHKPAQVVVIFRAGVRMNTNGRGE